MKVHFPELEHKVRADARTEMRGQHALWKDYKRHRKGWVRRQLGRGRNLIVYFFLSWILVVATYRGHGIRPALIVISLYATATTFFRGLNFGLNALQGFDRALFLHFPVSDADFLKYEWKKFGWSWIGAAVQFAAAYAVSALLAGWPARQFGYVALAAALQAFCGLTLSLWLLALFPKMKIVASAFPIYVLTFACIWLPPSAIDFLWSAVLLVPGGWISHSFLSLTDPSTKPELLPLGLAWAICLSLPIAFQMASRRLLAALESQTADDAPLLRSDSELLEEESAEIVPTETTFSQQGVFQRPDWDASGWLERIVGRGLREEDKLVAEFMLGQDLGSWSKRWRVAALISAGGLAIAVLAPLPPWAFFLPVVAAALCGAPLLGGIWPGFSGAPTFGGVVPTYAVFPLGYREISRMMLKTNTILILAWAPLVIAYAAALAARLGNGPASGLVMGIEAVLLALTLQPAVIVGRFSAGTNDSRQINLQTVAFFGLAFILVLLLVTAMGFLFASDSLVVKFVAAMGILACTSTAWVAYMLLFTRGRVDLLSRPR